MEVEDVNKTLLSQLKDMGFSEARATKAITRSGNSSIEAAINWIIDHENDEDIDEMPLPSVTVDIEIEGSNPPQVSEQAQLKAQELSSSQLRDRARRKKEEENRKLEREREKERIRTGKELLNAKRIAEENERQRFIAERKADREEERRAREKIRQKLQQDKLVRSKIGLQKEGLTFKEPGISSKQERWKSLPHESPELPIKSTSMDELMRDCLRSLKLRNKGDASRVNRAFETLLIYVRNVVNNPDDPKFRRIRISNPAFQDRVGRFKEGVEFLELCGFEKAGQYLVLPRDKVVMNLLKLAIAVIHSAQTNPYFGVLSKDNI